MNHVEKKKKKKPKCVYSRAKLKTFKHTGKLGRDGVAVFGFRQGGPAPCLRL